MLLTVRHRTHYAYEPPATGVALRLKLFPAASGAQKTHDWSVVVNGKPIEPLLTDGAGDRIALWHAHGAASEIEIIAGGTVETTDTTGVLRGVREAMPPAVYLRETPVTAPSPGIRALAEHVDGDEVLPRLHALSEAVAEAVVYKSGATKSDTTAAEAIILAEGVCQDQTHVFIAAARSIGIPARYVAGYVLDPDLDENDDGHTHAWAEAHVPGLGWVGFDVTHQLCPTDAYIRLASGFDASDAAPIRGTFTGEVDQVLTSSAMVAQAASQSQSQQ